MDTGQHTASMRERERDRESAIKRARVTLGFILVGDSGLACASQTASLSVVLAIACEAVGNAKRAHEYSNIHIFANNLLKDIINCAFGKTFDLTKKFI